METKMAYGNPKLNRDVIKYIAMLTMLLNHISQVFMKSGYFLSELFLDIGYFTAITMCYFLVEGFQYTHSKKNYAIRLLIFALISEIPYCMAFTTNGVLEFQGLNMLFTLLICFMILIVNDKVSNKFSRGSTANRELRISLMSSSRGTKGIAVICAFSGSFMISFPS